MPKSKITNNMKNNYKPIDCDLYDELVLLIMRKQRIQICIQNENGLEEEMDTVLKDIYSKEGEEFVLLENGNNLRLDKLVKIDGKDFEGYCGVNF
jgi:Rho-binding antiterminator